MWISIDKISWNSDVLLTFKRDEAIAYEHYLNHYSHLENIDDRKKAVGQAYDIIDKKVNGGKPALTKENIPESTVGK